MQYNIYIWYINRNNYKYIIYNNLKNFSKCVLNILLIQKKFMRIKNKIA